MILIIYNSKVNLKIRNPNLNKFLFRRYDVAERMVQMIISMPTNQFRGNAEIEPLVQNMHMDANSHLPGTLNRGLRQ